MNYELRYITPGDEAIIFDEIRRSLIGGYTKKSRELFLGRSETTYEISWADNSTIVVGAI